MSTSLKIVRLETLANDRAPCYGFAPSPSERTRGGRADDMRGGRMPVIRIGNYRLPSDYEDPTNVEADWRRLWRNDVRQTLWQAIKKIGVPGLEERSSVTFVFDPEWEPAEGEAADPKITYVFLEGFEDREDRPTEMRHALAQALGKALALWLADDWSVEVMPKRYDSEREGATFVKPDEIVDKSRCSPLRYKFRLLVFQNGRLDEEVETAVHTFDGIGELNAAIVEFMARNSQHRNDPNVQALWANRLLGIHPPSTRQGFGPSTTLIIKEIIAVG